MSDVFLIGRGVLTWNKKERVTDRYGAVYLIGEGHDSMSPGASPSLVDATVERLVGRHGKLVATVIQARKSTHIGDLFHGVFPRTPKVGSEIVLGEGTLFSEPAYDGGIVVGLVPADGRESQWLSMRALYDAHEQTVDLRFEAAA